MKNTDAEPAYETLEIGTPADYTSDMYRVYFEVGEYKGMVLKLLAEFLGEERAKNIVTLAYGYEVELPIQCIPEIVILLAEKNIAVYQVIRYAKTKNVWS